MRLKPWGSCSLVFRSNQFLCRQTTDWNFRKDSENSVNPKTWNIIIFTNTRQMRMLSLKDRSELMKKNSSSGNTRNPKTMMNYRNAFPNGFGNTIENDHT